MDEQTSCSKCGKPADRDFQMGLCADCLLAGGVGSVADATAAGARARFVPPEVSEIAPLFPQLEVLEPLGCGGMGAVYKARQKNLDRFVALKMLPAGIGSDPAFAARFSREAKALAKLNHSNIVTIYDFGQAGELFYFLMEYVDGVNLGQLLRSGRISSREALAIVPQICDALQYAHDAGIVHRDIKPENILLDRKGRVKVADFGLAKLIGAVTGESESGSAASARPSADDLTAGHLMGTPQYMAPEQVAHPSDVDHRADIYSLGVVFYQMLTGELPKGDFAAPSKKVVVDVRLDEVVLRAMEKRPELRYQQVSDVKTMCETIATTPLPLKVAAPSAPSANHSWQSPTSGWGWLIGKMFGITFTSPLAYKCANLSALGFLGALGFLSECPLPGAHRLAGFFGLYGLFGLIGLAFIIEHFRATVIIGQRGGRAVVHWPGVLFLFMIKLLVVGTVVMVGSLAIIGRIAPVPLIIVLVSMVGSTAATVAVILKKTPLEKLKSLDEPFLPFKSLPDQNSLPMTDFWQALEACDYSRAWNKTAPYLQREFPQVARVQGLEPRRRPLGQAVSRKQLSMVWLNPQRRFEQTSLTTFSTRQMAKETVVCALQPDGEWCVEKYALGEPVPCVAAADATAPADTPPPVPSVGKASAADSQSLGNAAPSRFSRAAIAGAVLVCFGLLLTPFLLWMLAQILLDSHWNPSIAEAIFTTIYGVLWLTCAGGGTFFGWIALAHIRRSVGDFRGLGLAVFDGLLFPLLILDGICGGVLVGLTRTFVTFHVNLANLNNPQVHPSVVTRLANQLSQHPEIALFVTVLLLLVVDFRIVRAVWCALNKGTAPQVPSAARIGAGSSASQSLIQDIREHMTADEKRTDMFCGILSVAGILSATFGTIYLGPYAMFGAFVIVFALDWHMKLLASTEYAKQQGVTIEQLRHAFFWNPKRLRRVWIALPLVVLLGAFLGYRLMQRPQYDNPRKELPRIPHLLTTPSMPSVASDAVIISGPPFIASYTNGTVDLIALASHTDTNAPCWQPDGILSKQGFLRTGGHSWAIGKVMKEIGFQIHSRTGMDASVKLDYDQTSGVNGFGAVVAQVDSRRPCIELSEVFACPPAARSMNVRVGVADEPWNTVKHFGATSVESSTDNAGNGYTCTGAAEKDGEAVVSMTQTKSDMETRMIAIGFDGREHAPSQTASGQAGAANQLTFTFRKLAAKDIQEFRVQQRPYHWVEFRNVSLQAGHRTTVEVVGVSGGSPRPSVEPLPSRPTPTSAANVPSVEQNASQSALAMRGMMVICGLAAHGFFF